MTLLLYFFAALLTKSAMKRGNAKAPTCNSGVQYLVGKRPALALGDHLGRGPPQPLVVGGKADRHVTADISRNRYDIALWSLGVIAHRASLSGEPLG